MSEEQAAMNRELVGGGDSKPCTLCGVPKPKDSLLLISGEMIGHTGGGDVDVCVDCYRRIQRGDVEPIGDPEF
jgi:hypothetical protein